MSRGKKLALLLGAIPFLTLVFALPLVNRIKPVVLGLPFILFWILVWVALTPAILFAADRIERTRDSGETGRAEDPPAGPGERAKGGGDGHPPRRSDALFEKAARNSAGEAPAVEEPRQ